MLRFKQVLAVVLAALLAPPGPVLADNGLGRLSGVVRSTTGSPLASIDVDFVSLTDGVARTLRTDGTGGLQQALEPGTYTIEARGYSIVRGPRSVTITTAESATIELTLQRDDPVAALPSDGASGAASTSAASDGGRRARDVVALAIFSGALLGVTIRAATVKAENPSPSR